MNAMEKVAWTEFLVSVVAIAAVTLLVPWLGRGALGAFGLLGFLGLTPLFLRKRGDRVVIDERDQEIQRKAIVLGVNSAWMMLSMTLIAAVLWSAHSHATGVSTGFLTWLIWVQFAVCYGIKGLVAVILYRRQHAA
jgi:hypothetical protein